MVLLGVINIPTVCTNRSEKATTYSKLSSTPKERTARPGDVLTVVACSYLRPCSVVGCDTLPPPPVRFWGTEPEPICYVVTTCSILGEIQEQLNMPGAPQTHPGLETAKGDVIGGAIVGDPRE